MIDRIVDFLHRVFNRISCKHNWYYKGYAIGKDKKGDKIKVYAYKCSKCGKHKYEKE